MDSTASTEPQTINGAVASRDRFLGCLLGGAVGDALGAAVEFESRAAILETFAPDGITDYAPIYGGLGRITDDTQMTLFTAEGLLRAWVRGCLKGITSYTGSLSSLTSAGSGRRELRRGTAWISFASPAGCTSSARCTPGAPPATPAFPPCARAHRRRVRAEPQQGLRRRDARGAGRPVPLEHRGHHSTRDTFRLGCELAAITHGHPTGQLTAGVLAVLIRELTDGASLPEALNVAKPMLREKRDHHETLRAIELAEHLATGNLPAEKAIARVGEGWIAEGVLAISLYCALVARDFRHGVILAVNHDGHSDSTGSITGNLLGTLFGVDAIPEQWLEPLQLREVITEIAEDLHDCIDWALSPFGSDPECEERIWRKYPGY